MQAGFLTSSLDAGGGGGGDLAPGEQHREVSDGGSNSLAISTKNIIMDFLIRALAPNVDIALTLEK